MSVHTAAGTRIRIAGQEPTPPTPPSEPTMTTANLNGSTCVMTVSDEESPVYLRNFGNVLHLVDASGKPIGQQESVDVGVFASECVQRVTVTLAHQGFWHEGLAQVAGKATAVEIKEGLRNRSASREAYWAHAVGSAPLCAQVKALSPIQGEAISFSLDPLEQAIESTVRALRDEHQQMADAGAKQDSALCDRLGTHLDALLAIQLERITDHE